MTTAKTRNEAAYARLRADIITGRWKSGDRLPFADLRDAYGTSVGVMREALTRLVEQGIIENRPQRGFFVVETSPDDLLNIAEVRSAVEVLAVRRAIETGGLDWESSVVAAHHRLVSTPFSENESQRYSAAWLEAHTAFHRAVLEGVTNARLVATVQQLRNMAELYAQWLPATRLDLAEALADEHRALTEAIVARDTEAAEEITRRHIARQARELHDNMLAASPS